MAVQAINEDALHDQGVQSFSDYVQYLPNINADGRGPGQSEMYIRGAAVDAINITVVESQGCAGLRAEERRQGQVARVGAGYEVVPGDDSNAPRYSIGQRSSDCGPAEKFASEACRSQGFHDSSSWHQSSNSGRVPVIYAVLNRTINMH